MSNFFKMSVLNEKYFQCHVFTVLMGEMTWLYNNELIVFSKYINLPHLFGITLLQHTHLHNWELW